MRAWLIGAICWLLVLGVIGMPVAAAGAGDYLGGSEQPTEVASAADHGDSGHSMCMDTDDVPLSGAVGDCHPEQHTGHGHPDDCLDVGCVANCAYCQAALTLPLLSDFSLSRPVAATVPALAGPGRANPFRPPILS